MKVLGLFPMYSAVDLLEETAVAKFLKDADKLLDTSSKGGNRLFLVAENDTARKLKEDITSARYVQLTSKDDLDLVELSPSMSDCYFVGQVQPALDLSVATQGSFTV